MKKDLFYLHNQWRCLLLAGVALMQVHPRCLSTLMLFAHLLVRVKVQVFHLVISSINGWTCLYNCREKSYYQNFLSNRPILKMTKSQLLVIRRTCLILTNSLSRSLMILVKLISTETNLILLLMKIWVLNNRKMNWRVLRSKLLRTSTNMDFKLTIMIPNWLHSSISFLKKVNKHGTLLNYSWLRKLEENGRWIYLLICWVKNKLLKVTRKMLML